MMVMEGRLNDCRKESSIYHIRVKGRLDEKWADWFEGFAMTARDRDETLLSGPVADQAALHGMLDRLHGLGLPLLLVMQVECPCTTRNCDKRGLCKECAAYHGENLPYCFREKTKWGKQCTTLLQAK
jgi:hypothetical protein